jgi:hypothetical protein
MLAVRSLLLFVLFAPAGLLAQERARPELRQEFWMSVGVTGRPSFLKDLLDKSTVKRIKTAGELGYRSADSFFAGKQVYLDLGAKYELSDHFTVGSEVRYAYRSDNGDRQRACALLQYQTKWERFDFGYRFDYQHNFRPIGEAREILRNKFSAGYNIRKFKLDPQFSVEFFQWAGYQGLLYFGTRYKLGTEWSPSKGHTFGLGIMHDRERAVYAPTYRFMLAVDYTLNLRKA